MANIYEGAVEVSRRTMTLFFVVDASGSMAGTPLEETKKASSKFINTVLEQDASIGIVTYDEIANRVSEFSMNQTALQNAVSEVGDGGGTNIEAGLYEARSMLQTSNAKKKIIVLMSDGEPNNGKVGEDLIAYADEIKKEKIFLPSKNNEPDWEYMDKFIENVQKAMKLDFSIHTHTHHKNTYKQS